MLGPYPPADKMSINVAAFESFADRQHFPGRAKRDMRSQAVYGLFFPC
jgi:hypothetical protein